MPYVEPVKAAAGIILTREPTPRVLLARRSVTLRFMGGFHVFPGGRIDDTEPTHTVSGALDTAEAAAVHAAAREIFEETGLLIVKGNCPSPAECRAARVAILDGEDTFAAFLERYDMHVDAAQFEPAGVWVTPAIAPIRFDTQYYICRVDYPELCEAIGGEIDALDWFSPADARAAWRAQLLQLPPPVAYVLQNLAAYPFPEVWEHLRSSGEHTGERPAKMEFANGIYLLPLLSATLPPATHTNCVIVGDRDLYIIDPGTHNDEELGLLTRQLQQLLNLGGTVKAIILTHSHIDHIGAAEYCRKTYNAPIWAHPETARQLQGDERSTGNVIAKDFLNSDPLHASHPSHTSHTSLDSLSPKPQTPDPKPALQIDRILHDGDIITIPGNPDWRLRAIHTPGHDPGHLCFIEETTRTLIGGDIIANPGTIVVSPDFGGDMTQFIESLQHLLTENFDTILPGHGMPLTNGKEKIKKHLEHRLWREEKVKAALATGATTIDELLPLAYDDTPEQAWPLAEHSLRAHLKRLNELGTF